ncbi:MAG: hypothetical protein JSS00_01510 [Proteobacteria bacterium]|nr:hypothetical protein [Pseudomonadota bacterium]
MLQRFALAALVLAAAACNQQSPSNSPSTTQTTQLDSPAPEAEPTRVFTPNNDAARTATGQLTVATATQLPDASQPDADAVEVLSLHGANGLAVEAPIASNVSPATQVAGQTLRALMSLPVEESQVLVYRVATETKPTGGQGLCGANATAFVVVWEPSSPGDASYKIMGTYGGAPGAAAAHACPMLEYRRS